MKVLWSSGIVYRPSGRLYIHTIPLFGCIYIHSHYRGLNDMDIDITLDIARLIDPIWLVLENEVTKGHGSSICILISH